MGKFDDLLPTSADASGGGIVAYTPCTLVASRYLFLLNANTPQATCGVFFFDYPLPGVGTGCYLLPLAAGAGFGASGAMRVGVCWPEMMPTAPRATAVITAVMFGKSRLCTSSSTE